MKLIKWGDILADPTLNMLAKRLNRRYQFMGEQDIEHIIQECFDSFRIMASRAKDRKEIK